MHWSDCHYHLGVRNINYNFFKPHQQYEVLSTQVNSWESRKLSQSDIFFKDTASSDYS